MIPSIFLSKSFSCLNQLLICSDYFHLNTSLFYNEYSVILTFLFVAIVLSVIIVLFSYILAVQNPETEKMSAYECGFEPYEDARQKFDVKFYIVAMLFIIFDIETMYLIPWCVSLPYINSVGYFVMMEFILELSVFSFLLLVDLVIPTKLVQFDLTIN